MTRTARAIEEKIVYWICLTAAAICSLIFIAILAKVFFTGLPSLTLYFLTQAESQTPRMGMGIANAIIGTVIISLIATVLAIPLALGTAVYLQRYAKNRRLAGIFRFFLEVLSGTPSIVIGIFGLLVLVWILRPITGGFSLIAGSIALSILIMPVIERSIEEAITKVPTDLEEGSYALGADRWQTVRNITLPVALSGILTGAILGFGRAAEESAVVILTAGYSQFIPEFTVRANSNLLFGIKIYPLQDLVGTMPYAVYNAYEFNNIVPISNAFAIAFVLILFVLAVNLLAKSIVHRYFREISDENTRPDMIAKIRNYIKKNTAGDKKMDTTELRASGQKSSSESVSNNPAAASCPPSFGGEQTPKNDTISNGKAAILTIFKSIQRGSAKIFSRQKKNQRKPAFLQTTNGITSNKAKNPGFFDNFVKTFLLTLAPFALITGILIILSFIVPKFGTNVSAGPGGFMAVLIFTLILGAVCTLVALFLLRGSLRYFAHKRKNRILGNRAGSLFAVIVGTGLVFGGAYLFTAHAFQPPDASPGGQGSGLSELLKNPLSLFGPGKNQSSMTQSTANRTAQLEALLAEDSDSEPGSPAQTLAATTTVPPVVPKVAATPVPAAATPSVPLKGTLSLREFYQYGNSDRRCIATVYNTTTLPFYFWWWNEYNRFVMQTPEPGNKYLVVFVRIENRGQYSAIVPSADAIIVTYHGTTYTHQSYFNTTYISDWQNDYYSTHLDKLPYQWIREVGQMKRDYAYLTGYNVFGQNTTRTDNLTDAPNPGSDINGKGFFLQPGSSNAIDGYLIFDVPDAVAKDPQNAYVQVAFNNISATRWRLGT